MAKRELDIGVLRLLPAEAAIPGGIVDVGGGEIRVAQILVTDAAQELQRWRQAKLAFDHDRAGIVGAAAIGDTVARAFGGELRRDEVAAIATIEEQPQILQRAIANIVGG